MRGRRRDHLGRHAERDPAAELACSAQEAVRDLRARRPRRLELQPGAHDRGRDPADGRAGHRRVQDLHGGGHRPQLSAHAGHRRARPRQDPRDHAALRQGERAADDPSA